MPRYRGRRHFITSTDSVAGESVQYYGDQQDECYNVLHNVCFIVYTTCIIDPDGDATFTKEMLIPFLFISIPPVLRGEAFNIPLNLQ